MSESTSESFLEGTQVRRVDGELFAGDISPAWNLLPLPQGGIVTALALRAMTEQLDDPAQRLRSLHTTFVGQVTDGPVEIQVEMLRRGRSMSHLRADLRNPGAKAGHLTTAIFGSTRTGFEFTDLELPTDLPLPADCPSFRDPVPDDVEPFEPLPFWTQVEGRPALGHAFWEDYEPDRAERAGWYRFDEPPFLPDGRLDPLSLVVLADFMPGALGEKVGHEGLGGRRWFAPSVDLTVHLLDECRSEWVLAHNRARHASDGYASGDMALWDCGPTGADGPRLVLYATQVFFFTFPD